MYVLVQMDGVFTGHDILECGTSLAASLIYIYVRKLVGVVVEVIKCEPFF